MVSLLFVVVWKKLVIGLAAVLLDVVPAFAAFFNPRCDAWSSGAILTSCRQSRCGQSSRWRASRRDEGDFEGWEPMLWGLGAEDVERGDADGEGVDNGSRDEGLLGDDLKKDERVGCKKGRTPLTFQLTTLMWSLSIVRGEGLLAEGDRRSWTACCFVGGSM